MPKITVVGEGTYEVDEGTRLVLAIEDSGVDILHRCGGNARCTTCRVEYEAGEPDQMTVAERDKLIEGDLMGQVRLSCQIACTHDMTVKPLMRVSLGDADSPGGRPADEITPEPIWVDKAASV